MENLRAVLFDFEGTLVDFQWNLKDAELELAQELVKMQFTPDDFAQTEGYDVTLNRALSLAVSGQSDFSPEEIRDRVGVIYDRYDLDALSRWQLLPGVLKTLNTLKETGYKLGLVTNLGRKSISKALLSFGLEKLFEASITRNDVLFFKPSGQGILFALSLLGIGKEDAVFVGDSLSDILAARNAGVKVISLVGGQCTENEILEHGPDHVILSIEKVIEAINSPNLV